jgi:Tfp pilus assembly protein PilF
MSKQIYIHKYKHTSIYAINTLWTKLKIEKNTGDRDDIYENNIFKPFRKRDTFDNNSIWQRDNIPAIFSALLFLK